MKLDMKLAWVLAAVLPLAACGDDGGGSDTDDGTSTGGASSTMTMTTNPSSSTDPATTDPATTDPATTDASSTTDPTDATSSTGDPGDSSSGEASGSGSTSGGVDGATVSGAVNTSLNGDGLQGDLYIGLLASCAQDGERVGSAFLEDVDLGAGPVTFMVPGMPDGTFYVTGFLDANQNSDMNDPGPDSGDPVGADGLGPACVEVTVSNGEDTVAPEALVLNLRFP